MGRDERARRWRVLDLFSGIGAFSLGLQRAGMLPTAFCEIDGYCRDVLGRHWPGVLIIEDARSATFPEAEIICGGFPCQDVSRAGKRAGVTGERSGLFRELVRAFRLVRPRNLIMENVAAILDDGMDVVLGELAEGRDCRWVEWDCVPANTIGACHERDRVWIVAHADGRGRHSGAASDVQHRSAIHDGDGVRSGEKSGRSQFQPGSARHTDGEVAAHAASDGCRQGRSGRPPDSFARIRDEARRNATDPYGARLAFRFGLGRDAFDQFAAAQRSRGEDVGQSIWPDESPVPRVDDAPAKGLDAQKIGSSIWPDIPALLSNDDEIADWVDRTKATGNTLDPLIPELIGRAILEQAAE